jgi:Putative DNA-binding domain
MSDLSWPPSPPWLSQLQQQFGRMLQTPLDTASGTLRATPRAYPSALVQNSKPARGLPGGERLAVYNRQYWFRLFTVLHKAFPLVTRLLGHWRLNQIAARFLSQHPPRGWDIDAVAQGFDAFLRDYVPTGSISLERPKRRLPAAALHEALALDSAYRRVFAAPAAPEYRPTAADTEHLLTGRLQFSPAAAVITESWALTELRQRALSSEGEGALQLEARLRAKRHWLLLRKGVALGLMGLEPLEAKLLLGLREQAVGVALALLESDCPAHERADLPARTRAWLARSVRLGVWSGLERLD